MLRPCMVDVTSRYPHPPRQHVRLSPLSSVQSQPQFPPTKVPFHQNDHYRRSPQGFCGNLSSHNLSESPLPFIVLDTVWLCGSLVSLIIINSLSLWSPQECRISELVHNIPYS
ncbi:hypothetical protein SISSUDRAFT_417846 [Sistotremastrum suecicum HHB10207 ss-3]|uniref:Uncharacterized protein n=1 Tax=Sistotremastrum suecicum HHB10207 ss-3 TaxID=1314776 RepID=A0A165YM28_9AGAM|nr:hypothetical protein SISSUDRAFT_417846 [Sistotremastrum suecicum HHB10207 ss-3]